MMGSLDSICPGELVIIGVLSDDMDAGELNVLGNFIVSVGGLMLTWAAQKELLESSNQTCSCDSDTFEDIKNQIKCLQDKCEKLECSFPQKNNSPILIK